MAKDTTALPTVPTQAHLRGQAAALYDEALGWVQAHWLQIALASAAAFAAYLIFNLLRRWGVKLCRQGTGPGNWYGILGRAVAKTGQPFMILASIRLVSSYADAPPSVSATIATLFTIVAVFQAAVWAREIIFGVVEHRTYDQDHQRQALASALGIIRLLVTIVLFAIAIILVLSNLGVNVTGLVAGLGVGGIAIGLAAQGIFADLFAALAILFDRPFRAGDSISYDKGSGSGTVEAIGLKSTRIRGAAGEQRIIANKKLLDFEILNTTRRSRNRFKFEFHLRYSTAPELILGLPGLLREVVENEGYRLIHGGVNAFDPSGLKYDVEFESAGPDFPADARDKVTAAILAAFAERGIGFAYPTRVNVTEDADVPALA